MAKQVTGTRMNSDGDITHLCGESWTHTKHEARRNINADKNAYVSGSSPVEVVNDTRVAGGFYLRTVADGTQGNNLDELPNC